MPELPDIVVYIEALEHRVLNEVLERVRLASPFVLRSVQPPLSMFSMKRVREIRRMGKQIVFALDDELFIVLHLMIAGRLQWRDKEAPMAGKITLAAFDFSSGTLLLTEAGSKKRASIHLARGEESLRAFDRGA